MEKNVQTNLLDEVKELPLPRVFNHMRLDPVRIFKPDIDFAFIWRVSPPSSDFMFYFTTLHLASQFCRKYSYNHSDAFWAKVYHPVYSYDSAVNSYSIGDNWR